METTPEAMQSATPTPGNWKIMMAESGIGMFFLRVCLFLINLITLFLAVPWTTVMYYNAWANNALIDGKRIKFTETQAHFSWSG